MGPSKNRKCYHDVNRMRTIENQHFLKSSFSNPRSEESDEFFRMPNERNQNSKRISNEYLQTLHQTIVKSNIFLKMSGAGNVYSFPVSQTRQIHVFWIRQPQKITSYPKHQRNMKGSVAWDHL